MPKGLADLSTFLALSGPRPKLRSGRVGGRSARPRAIGPDWFDACGKGGIRRRIRYQPAVQLSRHLPRAKSRPRHWLDWKGMSLGSIYR